MMRAYLRSHCVTNIGLVTAAFIGYGMLFLVLYPAIGTVVCVLVALPVVTAGWRWGIWGGLSAGLVVVLASTLLLTVRGQVDSNIVMASGWVAVTIGSLTGAVVEQRRNRNGRQRKAHDAPPHLWFLASMNRVNRAIQGTTDLDQMLRDVLDEVLSIFDCDRAFLLYPCDPEADSWQVPMERTKPAYPGAHTLGVVMPMDTEVATSLRILREADHPVKFGPGTPYPLPAEVAARFGFKSFMSMALYPKVDKPWQFGIHQCAYPRSWTAAEERLLQEIGQRLADGLTSLLVLRRLQESEHKLTAAQRVAHIGHWDYNFDTDCITGSDETRRIFGLSTDVSSLTLTQFLDLIHPADRQQVAQAVASVHQDTSPHAGEYRVVRPDGEVRLVHCRWYLTAGGPGQSAHLFGTVQDITERKQAEEALQHANDLLRAVIEAAPVAIIGLDLDGNVQSVWNPAAEKMLGWRAEEVVGRFLPSVPVESQTEFSHFREQIRRGLTLDGVEVRRQRRDGTPIEYSIYASPLHNTEGHITGNIAVLVDITERKRMEQALITREREYRTLVEHSPDFIVRYNTDLRRIYVNPAWEKASGLSAAEVVNVPVVEIPKVPHPTVAEYMEKLREVLATGVPQSIEFNWVNARGVTLFLEYVMVPEYDHQEQVVGVLAVGRDLTRRRQAEEALVAERTLLRTLIDNLPDHIYAKDTASRFVLKNLADVRQMGAASPDEVVGKTDFDYYPPELAEKYHADDQAVLQSGQPLINREEPIITADGTQSWLLTSKVPLRDAEGHVVGLVGIGRDITERKQAEEALQRYTQRLAILREIDQRIVVTYSPDAIAHAVLDRLVHLIPCEWAGIILCSEENAEAHIIARQQALDTYIQIDQKIPFISTQILERLKTGQSTVTTDLQAEERPWAALASHLMAGLQSGVAVPLMAQNRLLGILALAARQVDFFTPEHQSIAEEIGIQVAIACQQAELNDQITRHTAELEQHVRERTRQLEMANEELRKLSQVKDDFVSNVSHELRTPITSLKLRQHLLAAHPDNWAKHLPIMSRETQRLEHIVESLLYLSRLDQDRVGWHPTRVNLNHLVSQFIRDRTALAQSQELTVSFTGAPDLSLVEVDVALWEQALSILLTNAVNYTSAGGHVAVSTHMREQAGQCWVGVSISDTGPGIAPDEQYHLFERFFRGTAGRASGVPGTGLGLSIVQEIVAKHHGQIEVLSEGVPGKGATFKLWLLATETKDEKQRVLAV